MTSEQKILDPAAVAGHDGRRRVGFRHRNEDEGAGRSRLATSMFPITIRLSLRSRTTLAILRALLQPALMIQGYHGTASRRTSNKSPRDWNAVYPYHLDSHISRIDLIARTRIVLRDGKQVTEFREGCCLVPAASGRGWRSTSTTRADPM